MIALPYPARRDEIIAFVKKHHYTRRCSGVWQYAYGIENQRGKLQAVALYGPAPYPNVARAFVKNREHAHRMIWQARLVGAGISSAQLDELLAFANGDLLKRGFWWVHTLTDHVEKVIEHDWLKLQFRGYDGHVYQRNGWAYLGTSGRKMLEGFIIDGVPLHVRQGAVTLTLKNIRDHFPHAKSIRTIYGNEKQRWAYILAENQRQRAERQLLMKYQAQPYQSLVQPRLLWGQLKVTGA